MKLRPLIADAEAEPARGRCRVDTHLCFGNFKGHAVGKRTIRSLFPDFLDFHADELHIEMTTTAFADLEVISEVVRRCLEYAPPERLVFAPDCGLNQTARWAARRKLANMVEGVRRVRREKGVE